MEDRLISREEFAERRERLERERRTCEDELVAAESEVGARRLRQMSGYAGV